MLVKYTNSFEKLSDILYFYVADLQESFEGCLLDNYLYWFTSDNNEFRYIAALETYVNTNQSVYRVEIAETEEDNETIENRFYTFMKVAELEKEKAEREYKEKHCKKVVKAVKAVTVYKDFPFFMDPDTHSIWTHNTLFPLFLEEKKETCEKWSYEDWIAYNAQIDLLRPAKTVYVKVAEE